MMSEWSHTKSRLQEVLNHLYKLFCKDAYKKKYGKKLSDAVYYDTSGYFRKTLMALLREKSPSGKN